MTVKQNTHRHLAVRVAARLEELRDLDPELYKLLSNYVTSLRFESARHRTRARQLQERLEDLATDNGQVAVDMRVVA